MNGKIGISFGIAAGAVVIGGLLYFSFAPVDSSEERIESRREKQKTGQVAASREPKKSKSSDDSDMNYKKSAGTARPKPFKDAPKDWFEKLPSAKDRAIAKKIQDAQDADDREAVFKAAEEALSSKNAEVRQAAVEALSLQGEAAIQPLLNFVGDEDKDVAEAAYRAWDDAADALDGDFAKLGAVKEVILHVKDAEHVKAAVGKIESFDQSRAIRELAKLAREGGKASEAAKESYENVTGEPFESWAAAELKALAIDRDNRESDGAGE